MDDMFSFIDLILVGAGIYTGYQWFCLKFKGEIMTGILLNKDVNVLKCKDKEGYIREASPKLLILTITILLSAGCNLLNTYVISVPWWITFAFIAIFLAVLVWVGFKGKELYEKYWGRPLKNFK